MYLCQPRSAMKTGRGCFSVTLNDGFVYVFGGVSGAQERPKSKEVARNSIGFD